MVDWSNINMDEILLKDGRGVQWHYDHNFLFLGQVYVRASEHLVDKVAFMTHQWSTENNREHRINDTEKNNILRLGQELYNKRDRLPEIIMKANDESGINHFYNISMITRPSQLDGKTLPQKTKEVINYWLNVVNKPI